MRSKKSSTSIDEKAMIDVFRVKLLQWISERHATDQPLNREILAEKVVHLSIQLGLRNFKCSKSWTTKFLKKHGFSASLTSLQGPTFDDYGNWIDLMRSYFMQYRYKNVFQVDEMGMYHDIPPDKIPHCVNNLTCKNGEYKENRVTVLLCCNASGSEKLPPVICGKFENRLHPDSNSYQYYANQNAWLTPDIFKVWLSQLNTLMSQSNRKILLLLNRTRVHTLKNSVLSNVTLMFLPKEFPRKLQPLKAHIFHYVKMIYRRSYTENMLQPNFNWTLPDTINSIVNSWNSVPDKFILSSFRKTNFRSDNDSLQISYPEWEKLNLGVPFRSFVTFDDDLCVSSSFTRTSKRLADIKTPGNRATCFVQGDSRVGGYNDPIELSDSDSDDIAVEEASPIPEIRTFGRSVSVVNTYDYIPDKLRREKNREIYEAQYSKQKVRDCDPNNSQLSEENQLIEYPITSTHSARPMTDMTILYIADIVENAVERVVENIPDVVEITSEVKGRAETDGVINCRLVEKDKKNASITRKRRREETDERDAPNEESLEQTEKRITGEEVWSDIYEHNFVFGVPDSSQATISASTDAQMALVHPAMIDSIQKSVDIEKKSIFTISQASSSRSQSQ